MGLQIFPNTAAQERSSPREASSDAIEPAGKHLPVASRLHLCIFLALQLIVVVRSGDSLSRLMAIKDDPTFHFHLVRSYGLLIFFELAQLLFVWYGIRKTNTTISDLIGGRWSSAWAVVKDVFIAVALWLLWMIAIIVLAIALHPQRHGAPITTKYFLAPPLEISLWIVISIAAGFCEEIVYRGYLQRQFLALWQSLPFAVFCQALIFAALHRYEGLFNVLAIGAMAVLFGTFAARRKSLRPGIMAHMWQDGWIGIVFFLWNLNR